MKVLCGISSIEFNVEHFPGSLYSRETVHPIFHLPQKKLLSYLSKWSGGELTSIDSYLLFLALLNSSELVEFRVPVFRNERTDSVIANNMEYLAKTVIKLNTVSTPSFNFPSFAITTETRYLDNIHYWLDNWDAAYQDFLDGYSKEYKSRQLIRREQALEKLIKSPFKPAKTLANQLADWAVIAGEFPTYLVNNPFTGLQISMADYWRIIIQKCSVDEFTLAIPKWDIEDCLEHCEINIPVGTIHSNALFSCLRRAIEKQENYLGKGDMSKLADFKFVSPNDVKEFESIQKMIDDAPLTEPTVGEYPKRLDYLKAKARWDMAQLMNKSPDKGKDKS